MTVDWTVPQQTYEELHAKLDALATERNAAAAEAKLWRSRYFDAKAEADQAQANYDACHLNLIEWREAHGEVVSELTRMQHVAVAAALSPK